MDLEYGPYDKLPAFYENTVVEISVPSGKLIAADDLRYNDYFDIESPMSINYGMGCDAWAKEYATIGVGYAFVGNSCPSVVKHEDGHLEVANFGWDEEKNEDELIENENIVASICTDLWATMITDYQNWLDNGGPEVTEADLNAYGGYRLIDVEPGTYRWTVYSHSDGFDRWGTGQRITYAELTRIGD